MPFFILLIVIAFSGCSSHSPAVSQFTLVPSYAQSQSGSLHSTKTVKLVTTETLPSLHTNSIRYTLENLESGAYLYGRWSDTPSRMLSRLLASSLQREKVFPLVLTTHSTTQHDWIVESELLAYEHRFTKGRSSQGFIDLSCRLVDSRTSRPIAAKRFTIELDAPSEDMQGGVQALQKASEELIHQQLEWLKRIANQNI